MSNLDRHPTSREGITCVVCHRLNKDYNKRSGRLALVQGSLLEPVYGPTGNEEMARVLENTDQYRVVTEEGIRFKVKVSNLTDGHNVPTGFTGERLVWLHVTVTDRDGKVVLESGDLDPNGDVRDRESSYVHNGELPLDGQLFDLRSRFVVSNLRGGERERIIPIPYPVITIPFVRPSIQSLILTGDPGTERNHRRSIEPLGYRWAKYRIDDDALTGKGPYKAKIELKAGMVPANLVGDIQGRGFDYAMSAREVADGVAAGYEILWEKEVAFKISN